MAINIATSSFQVVSSGFALPGLGFSPNQPNQPPHIRPEETIFFDLPNEIQSQGLLSFVFDTQKGNDDGIDLAFEISVNASTQETWFFRQYVFTTVQWPISGLRPGQNNIIFNMTKGGTRTEPDPDEFLGGKGIANFWGVTVYYQIPAQEGWRWCTKCEGLFFSGHQTSRCPAGGSHSAAGSGLHYVLPHAD